MGRGRVPVGRRERAKRDKRERIMAAARELFAERGVSGVTTQQVADRADVAIGTLYRYVATKAEFLIMVQTRPDPGGLGQDRPDLRRAEPPSAASRPDLWRACHARQAPAHQRPPSCPAALEHTQHRARCRPGRPPAGAGLAGAPQSRW